MEMTKAIQYLKMELDEEIETLKNSEDGIEKPDNPMRKLKWKPYK